MPSVVGKGMSSGRGREGALLCLGVGSHQTTLSPSVSYAYVRLTRNARVMGLFIIVYR